MKRTAEETRRHIVKLITDRRIAEGRTTPSTAMMTTEPTIAAAAATSQTVATVSEKATLLQKFIHANQNPNTRRTYDTAVKGFHNYLNRESVSLDNVQPVDVADYLRTRITEQRVSASTLAGDRAAIADNLKYTSNAGVHLHPLVKDTLKVCTSMAVQGVPKRHMTTELLETIIRKHDSFVPKSWVGERNMAMMLVMMAGMLRESEATALRMEDVEMPESNGGETPTHMIVRVRRSKTDQNGKGASVIVTASANTRMCPIRRLRQYLTMRQAERVKSDFLFCTVSGDEMSRNTPCAIVKKQVETVNDAHEKMTGVSEVWGPSKEYGSHSLRRGGVTEARMSGVDMLEIQRHGRWKSAVVWNYVGPTVQQQMSVTRSLFDKTVSTPVIPPLTPKKPKFNIVDPMVPRCEPWRTPRKNLKVENVETQETSRDRALTQHPSTLGSQSLISSTPPVIIAAAASSISSTSLPPEVTATSITPPPTPRRLRTSPAKCAPTKKKLLSDSSSSEDESEMNEEEKIELDQEMESWQEGYGEEETEEDRKRVCTRMTRGSTKRMMEKIEHNTNEKCNKKQKVKK